MHCGQSASIHVLGAGPAGLAAAYTLAKAGLETVVYERGTTSGGLAGSFEHQGFILDYGPHFITKEHPLGTRLWREVVGDDHVELTLRVGMYWRNHLLAYPPGLRDLVDSAGASVLAPLAWSLAQGALTAPRAPSNYAERAKQQFGAYAFENIVRPQVEKLWGQACETISPSWQAGSARGAGLRQLVARSLRGHRQPDKLLHPRFGSGQPYTSIASYLANHHQPIRFGTEIVAVEHNQASIRRIIVQDSASRGRETVDVSDLVSSLPLSVLVRALDPPPPSHILDAVSQLTFRNTILVYVLVDGITTFPYQTIYVPHPRLAVGRVTNFANWSPEMSPSNGKSMLCCEYWCSDGDVHWESGPAEQAAQAIKDLDAIGLLSSRDVEDTLVRRVPRSHPVMGVAAEDCITTVHRYLEGFRNLSVVGRGGAFRYQDQDGVLAQGIRAADAIVEQRGRGCI